MSSSTARWRLSSSITALSLILTGAALIREREHGTIEHLLGMALHLFAPTSLGILLGTVARSMPQLGLLMVITLLPPQILSGGMTPFESMPDWARKIMQVAPTTHFVSLVQAIIYRGADISIVWPQINGFR